jgi:hypothetical protein
MKTINKNEKKDESGRKIEKIILLLENDCYLLLIISFSIAVVIEMLDREQPDFRKLDLSRWSGRRNGQ